MTETEYLTAISAFLSFGPARIKLLISYFKKAKNIWSASTSELIKIGLKAKTVSDFENHRKNFDIEKYFQKLDKLSVRVLSIFDKDYPANLKDLIDAPCILYIKGNIKKSDTRSVAIVGSRMMTSYGKEVAGRFATQLADFGITVISGLALGVDGEAQRSALSAGGRTIAVLASGLDIISPLANRNLALELIKGSGALISEYPLNHEPMPYDFPVRDRIIAGMSKAVIVIEARMKSGTFYTVKAALDQGKPVFSVPGPITSPASEGTNYLIQNGAKPITSIKDVIDELHLQNIVNRDEVEKVMPGDASEAKILSILDTEPLHLDELVRISGGKTSEISARLTIMEMKGMVRSIGNGIYKKT